MMRFVRLSCAAMMFVMGAAKFVPSEGAPATVWPGWLILSVGAVEMTLGLLAVRERTTLVAGRAIATLGGLFVGWIVVARVAGVADFGCGCLGTVELNALGRTLIAGSMIVMGGILQFGSTADVPAATPDPSEPLSGH